MAAYFFDWLALLLRWFHVLAAIAWVGGSLFYIWIDNHLEKPPEQKSRNGSKGEVWVIHGGGIYEFQKYHQAPPALPEKLHWVKWESYVTWLTGISLLICIYYVQASTYMMIPDGIITTPLLSAVAGVLFILTAVAGYELLIRTPLVKRGVLFALLLGGFFTVLSYVSMKFFAPRAAVIHLGAAMGSIMVGNVFLGIIPAQKQFISAIQNNQKPDINKAQFAKQRSMHNNYLTLPVLFCMIAHHYPMLYAQHMGWLTIASIAAISALIRHYFNLRHLGENKPLIPVASALALGVMVFLVRPEAPVAMMNKQHTVSVNGMQLIKKHCANCHSQHPQFIGIISAPAGLTFDSREEVLAVSEKIRQVAVLTQFMPFGNESGMTENERADLDQWLREQQFSQRN